jgi:glycosyltransferase involved in cell wall biosynthesis
VGFVGTLKPWHGVDALIRAFAQASPEMAGARLLIVGDGPERAGLEQLGATLGINVHYTGSVEPDAVPGLVASMDVCVAPYPRLKIFYFSPLKLFEYMAAGRAVIAARTGQVAQVLTHGHDGLLYAAGDERALADAIVRLSGDPGLRAELGANARNTVEARYTWDRVAAHILALAARPRQASITVAGAAETV